MRGVGLLLSGPSQSSERFTGRHAVSPACLCPRPICMHPAFCMEPGSEEGPTLCHPVAGRPATWSPAPKRVQLSSHPVAGRPAVWSPAPVCGAQLQESPTLSHPVAGRPATWSPAPRRVLLSSHPVACRPAVWSPAPGRVQLTGHPVASRPATWSPTPRRVQLPATRWPAARRPGARLHGYFQCDPTRHAHGSGYCLTTPAD